jgi:hypothetical protein
MASRTSEFLSNHVAGQWIGQRPKLVAVNLLLGNAITNMQFPVTMCRRLPPSDVQMELRVPADQEAVHPLWVMVGVEREVLGLLKELREHGAGLYARECRSDAEMDAVPECQVALGGSPRQVNAIGVVELGMVSIPGSEEQQDRGTGRDVDTECGGAATATWR